VTGPLAIANCNTTCTAQNAQLVGLAYVIIIAGDCDGKTANMRKEDAPGWIFLHLMKMNSWLRLLTKPDSLIPSVLQSADLFLEPNYAVPLGGVRYSFFGKKLDENSPGIPSAIFSTWLTHPEAESTFNMQMSNRISSDKLSNMLRDKGTYLIWQIHVFVQDGWLLSFKRPFGHIQFVSDGSVGDLQISV
jgi:hypothetical protein